MLYDNGELSIVFYEYDSEFDGNDFEYIYSLDASNADAFLQMISRRLEDKKTTIEEWLMDNIRCGGLDGDLQEMWIRMGLHGRHIVSEDYPGGIYREEEF